MNAADGFDPSFGAIRVNPVPTGPITVSDTSTPVTPSGTPHPFTVPPWAAKFPPVPATWNARDPPPMIVPPALRVSTTRHGAASGTYDAPLSGAK